MTSSQTPAAGGHPAVQEVSPHQLHAWLQSGEAFLVDVREPDEHARERIAGARLVPLSRFSPQQAAAGLQPGQRLVMHCKGGRRSADAARLAAPLAASGVVLCSLAGGIEAWKKDNLPTVLNTGVARISVMRQVQLVIGVLVLTGSALAWFVHPAFIAVTAFFGAGLTFAGASGTCLLANIMGAMPWNKGAAQCQSGACG